MVTNVEFQQNNSVNTQRYFQSNKCHGLILFLIDVLGKSEVYLSFIFLFISLFLIGEGGVSTWHSLATNLTLLFGYVLVTLLNERSRRKGDQRVNRQPTRRYVHKERDFKACQWKDLRQGDIICVYQEEEFPADVLILDTSEKDHKCLVDTSSLTEDHNLRIKYSCEDT